MTVAAFNFSSILPNEKVLFQTNESLTGIWKIHTLVNDQRYDYGLVKITRKGRNKLRAFIIDLKSGSLAWADIDKIEFNNGNFSCNFPDWGGSRFIFNGKLSEDGNVIYDPAVKQHKREWTRVEESEIISLVEEFVSSYGNAKGRKYKYINSKGLRAL